MPAWVIPAFLGAWGVLSSLVAYGYATGKFVGKAATHADLQVMRATIDALLKTLRAEIASDRAEQLKVRDQKIQDLGRRIGGEHEERKRVTEEFNATVGTLQVQVARQDERLKAYEDRLKVCERQNGLFPGRWPSGGGQAT